MYYNESDNSVFKIHFSTVKCKGKALLANLKFSDYTNRYIEVSHGLKDTLLTQ